jgi:hypothetical protein
MEKTQRKILLVFLLARPRVPSRSRAKRCDVNWRSDHPLSLSLSLFTDATIHRENGIFFYLALALFLSLWCFFFSSFLFFSLTLWVTKNDDHQVDENRWVDTFEQLIGRQDSLFALCLEQLSLPFSLLSLLRLALLTLSPAAMSFFIHANVG